MIYPFVRILVAAVVVTSVPAAAQIRSNSPRTSGEGIPHDLSGIWMQVGSSSTFSDEAPPVLTSWGAERFASNKPTLGPTAVTDANDPTLRCIPPGVPYVFVVPLPFEILQSAGQVTILFEYDHTVRRIHTDGRPHPKDLHDSESFQWMGHSIGTWEQDTLVVDTVGFNDQTWLDRLGHPHSEALHITERIRREDQDTLDYRIIVDDPKAYTGLWRGRRLFKLRAAWGILDHSCSAQDSNYVEYKKRASDAKAK